VAVGFAEKSLNHPPCQNIYDRFKGKKVVGFNSTPTGWRPWNQTTSSRTLPELGRPCLDAPEGRRDDFVDPYLKQAKTDKGVVISFEQRMGPSQSRGSAQDQILQPRSGRKRHFSINQPPLKP
jgi:hypothetical protein